MRNGLIVLGIAGGLLAQSNTSVQDFSKAHTEYLSLNRQILAIPDDPESGALYGDQGQTAVIENRLHTILKEAIQSVLASSRPTASAVKSALDAVQGDLAMSTWGDPRINLPFAEFFQVDGSENMAVAYGIPAGGAIATQSKTYVEFYSRASGTWKLQATTGSDFDGSMVSVSSIASGAGDEKWLLAWGKWFGDTGSRLHLRLYGYNGASVGTVWKRDELVRGAIQVSPTGVTLEYDKEYHSAERVREVLHVTANGLE